MARRDIGRYPGSNANVGLAINAAASNMLTQGFAVATGLQSSFNWRAVAVSAVAAPAVRALGSTTSDLGEAVGGGLMGQTTQALEQIPGI